MAPELKPCGTPAAYRRHLRHGEEPCEACRNAELDRRNPGRTPRAIPDCGTVAGYARHLRLKERTCEPCKRAHAKRHREYRSARLAKRAAS